MSAFPANRAQAESLGSLLLVAVVVISATTFGAYYVASTSGGGAGGSAGSAGGAAGSTADVTLAATEETLRLSHNGGPSVPIEDLRVTVENGSGEYSYAFSDGRIRNDGGENGQFDPGETWRLGWTQSPGTSVTIALVNTDSETLVLRETTTVGSDAAGETRGNAEGTDTNEAVVDVDAGPQRTVSGEAGSSVVLDGTVNSAASDLDYEWEITDDDDVAEGAIELTEDTTTEPTFEIRENVTDRDHTVEVEFTASNDTASGADQTAVLIERFNRPPVADAGEDREWSGGDDSDDDDDDDDGDDGDDDEDDADALAKPVTVTGAAVIYPPNLDSGLVSDTDDDTELDDSFVELDGTGSYDPDGDELQYEWRVVDQGDFEDSDLNLVDSESATPKLSLLTVPDDERRNITVELTVTDTSGVTDADRVNVTVVPSVEDDDDDGWWDDDDDGWWDDWWDGWGSWWNDRGR
ncbi:PKD domain-containing protein [Halobellus rarus]|uniref:Uncharacterized protein n=1 Tax=Halobellus rarus TaxID=1126237 RepID=A0ABD6CPE8_9EURY|nr:hypothetical protein [Halobellus rarus]